MEIGEVRSKGKGSRSRDKKPMEIRGQELGQRIKIKG